jgi:Rrf2 family iron-sulfur cluster assembly transcriptional regulator
MSLINRDTDYAVRAMAHLANKASVVSVSTLAENEGIPDVFLRKIMQRLHRAGLVASVHGPLGGYKIAREPGNITVLDILQAIQGPVCLNACFADPALCKNIKVCAFRKELKVLQKEINSWLAGITLSDVLAGMPQAKGVKS